MKNITKNLIISTFILGLLAIALPTQAAAQTSTVFSTDGKVSLGAQTMTNTNWASTVSAGAGETVTLKIRYKNTGNWDATNTKVQLTKTISNGVANFAIKVFADNTAYPATGSATVNFPAAETISYVDSSLNWYPNQSTVSASLPFGQNGSEIFGSGLNIGVIKSKFSCPESNPDCREGNILLQFKVSGQPPVVTACNDGIDNDGDGLIDLADPGCTSSTDNDEYNAPNSTFSITTAAATAITQTSATLNATFANASGSSVLVWFQYGKTTSLGSNTPVVTVDSAAGQASVNLTGLDPNTTYYFRAVAKDAGSIKNASNILNFKTGSTPTSNLDVSTLAATNVGQNSATLNASFTNAGSNSVSVWFEYGTSISLGTNSGTVNVSASAGNASVNISGLAPNTTYYFKAIASDGLTTKNATNILSFTTTAPPPTNNLPPNAYTTSPSSITETSAVLNGQINPNGSPTTVWFEYGLSASNLNRTVGTQNIGAGNSIINVSFPISQLEPATTYFYRVVASNAYGTTPGQVISFTTNTIAANAPKVITSLATSVTKNSAKLNGLVVIDTAAPTKAYFEYGKTAALGLTTDKEIVGSVGQIPFNQVVTDLSPNTIYFFRAVAENANGLARGDIMVFKTAAESIVSHPTTGNNTGNNSTNTNTNNNANAGLVSLKVTSNFSEVSAGDIIDFKIEYQALADLNNVILRLSLPETMNFRKATNGVYSSHDRALIAEIGLLPKNSKGEMTVQVEITNKIKDNELLAATALMTFNTATGASEDALAYGLLKAVKKETNLLGAAALFGSNSFLPDTLLEWIILIAVLGVLILVGREIYFRGGKKAPKNGQIEDLAGFKETVVEGSLPEVPTSRYANH